MEPGMWSIGYGVTRVTIVWAWLRGPGFGRKGGDNHAGLVSVGYGVTRVETVVWAWLRGCGHEEGGDHPVGLGHGAARVQTTMWVLGCGKGTDHHVGFGKVQSTMWVCTARVQSTMWVLGCGNMEIETIMWAGSRGRGHAGSDQLGHVTWAGSRGLCWSKVNTPGQRSNPFEPFTRGLGHEWVRSVSFGRNHMSGQRSNPLVKGQRAGPARPPIPDLRRQSHSRRRACDRTRRPPSAPAPTPCRAPPAPACGSMLCAFLRARVGG